MNDKEILVHKQHSWPEDLTDENGNYLNRCIMCGCTFQGHKRRMVCRVCAAPLDTTVREER